MIHEVNEQVTEYKVVIPKSIIFLNTSIGQLEIEIKKKYRSRYPKNMKYLRNIFNKICEDLYPLNFEILLKF